MSDIHNDNDWMKTGPGHWGYTQRGGYFAASWSDYRGGVSALPADPRHFAAFVACTGERRWQVYVHGVHTAAVESWNEAKELAALLLGAQEAK